MSNEPELGPLRDVLLRARALGFLGPGPIDEHLAHARGFLAPLGPAGRCLDLGSGGGVPGLVLAVLVPATSWLLLDAMERRVAFLDEAIDRLGLEGRVASHRGRAEDVPPELRETFDAVTARGFGPPPVTAECAAGWLRAGGVLMVSEPPGGDPGRWEPGALGELGFGPPTIEIGPPAVAVIPKQGPTPARYPRRPGMPAKRPLWTT